MENKYIKLFFAVLAVILMLSIAFVLGYIINSTTTQVILNNIQQYQQNLNQLQLAALLGSSKSSLSCAVLNSSLLSLSSQLGNIDAQVAAADLENQSGTQYVSLVNQLTYARADYWLLAQRINEQCNDTFTTVLMFYDPANCQNCVLEGDYLSFIASNNNNLIVVSLDRTWNLNIVSVLARLYNVTSSPAIVVDSKYTVSGYLTTSQILSTLCKDTNESSFCNQS